MNSNNYTPVDINSHQRLIRKSRIKYEDYETAILLKSRLQAMLREFGEEMCIDYDSWFIVDKGPNIVGRFRNVICFLINQDEMQISKIGNLSHQLRYIFGYPDTSDIWKITTHVLVNPMAYEKEIRLCRYFLIKHRVLNESTPIEYFLSRRRMTREQRRKYKGVDLTNQTALFP